MGSSAVNEPAKTRPDCCGTPHDRCPYLPGVGRSPVSGTHRTCCSLGVLFPGPATRFLQLSVCMAHLLASHKIVLLTPCTQVCSPASDCLCLLDFSAYPLMPSNIVTPASRSGTEWGSVTVCRMSDCNAALLG